jgi:predicted MFS family arabinose efflux permease
VSSPPSPAGPPSASGAVFAPFAYPAFRAIWAANLASNLGSVVQSVAAAWLMTELTPSHQLVALVQASASLPILLLGLFAGVIADNHDRRKVMLAAQFIMLAASALLAALTWAGLIGPLSLLALTLAVGCGTALNSPAWQASVRLQVGPAVLSQAISLNSIAFNLARSVGPALGGLLISLTGPAAAFALNSLSYLALIAVLLRWQPDAQPRTRQPMFTAIREGAAFCARSSPLRRALFRGAVFGFGATATYALLPLVVREQIHGQALDYGLVLGAFGLGSIVTALWIAPARRRWGSEAVVTAATLIFALAMLPLAATSNLAVAIAAAALSGGGWVATWTSINVAVQLRSPEALLGRCLSIYQAVTFGGLALGAWVWGLVSDLAGLPLAIRSAACLMLLSLPLLRWLAPMPAREEGRVAPR